MGPNPQHTSKVGVPGQPLNHKLADILYDTFVEQEKAERLIFGEAALTVHYQATLIEGESFYMVRKDGPSYPSCPPDNSWVFGAPCGPNAWDKIDWNVLRYDWEHGQPISNWKFLTDWKPEPNGTNFNIGIAGLVGSEPVFHPALSNGYLYVPGAAGTIWKVDKRTGRAVSHTNPFTSKSINASNTFVAGPLTADAEGNIVYNVIKLNQGDIRG